MAHENDILIIIRPKVAGIDLYYEAFEEDGTPLACVRNTPEDVQEAVRFRFKARASRLNPVFRQEEQ